MIGWWLGFCSWHHKVTDLITAGCRRCFIYNWFAKDSLKTSSKHLAIRDVWGEISQLLIAEAVLESLRSGNCSLRLRTRTMSSKTVLPMRNLMQLMNSAKKDWKHRQCVQCVCICVWLSPIGTCTRLVSSSAFRNLTPPQNKRQVLFSVGDGHEFRESWGTADVYFHHCKLASLEMNADYFGGGRGVWSTVAVRR